MKKHPACIITDKGWIELNDKEAYRFIMDKDSANIIESDFFKNKMGVFWLPLEKSNKQPEDVQKKFSKIYSYKLDYIPHVNRYTEWAPKQFIDAIKLLCDIHLYCISNNVYIVTHLWNFTLRNGSPILIDIGDFTKNKPSDELLLDSILGTFRNKTDNHCPILASKWVKNYGEILNLLNIVKNKKTDIKDKFLEIKEIVNSKVVLNNDNTYWSNYIKDIPHNIDEIRDKYSEKSKVICDVIDKRKPITLTDLGCNIGVYSFYASKKYNIPTIGMDNCISSIEFANQYSEKNNLNCSFICYDLLNPPPPYGLNGVYGKVEERFKSEGVIAPAIIHHLFRQKKSINEIIKKISEYSNKWLLLEYIPHNCKTINVSVNNWFSKDQLENALKSNGWKYEIINSSPSPRKWYLCDK